MTSKTMNTAKQIDEKEDESPRSRLNEISSGSGPWLNAWYDPMAHLNSTSARIATVDITNDGNHALLVVDDSKRLKVFRGMNLISSHKLLDLASCLAVFHPSSSSNSSKLSSSLPAIAVATGCYIYIYRSMRPYYKFTVPALPVDAEELDIWNQCRSGDSTPEQALEALSALKLKSKELTFRSLFILSMTEREEQIKFINSYSATELARSSCITTMTAIHRGDTDNNAVSSLIVGTESGELHFLDFSGSQITTSLQIPAVPLSVAVIGLLSIDYRVVVATRSAVIYTVRNGKLLGNYIEMESAITAMAAWNQNIVVSTLNRTLSAFHIKGSNVKLWSLYFKSGITCIEPLIGSKFSGTTNNFFVVGFENGHVAMYNNKIQIHLLQFNMAPITALKFGKYGREDSALIILNKTGCLNVKIMSRRADMKRLQNIHAKHQQNRCQIQQEIPLSLPPITQLFLDQELREKEEGVTMHQIWNREMVKFKVNANKQYINVLRKGSGKGGGSLNQDLHPNQLMLNVQVIGIGPTFTLRVDLKNTDKRKCVRHLLVVVLYDSSFYQIHRPLLHIPALVPLLSYKYRLKVRSVEPNGNAKPIRIAICHKTPTAKIQNAEGAAGKSQETPFGHFPVMSAIVDMPISDINI